MDEAEKMRWLTALLMRWIAAIVRALTGLRLAWWGSDEQDTPKQVAAAVIKSEQPELDAPREIKSIARRILKGLPIDQAALSEPVIGALVTCTPAERLWLVAATPDQLGTWVSAAHGVARNPYNAPLDLEADDEPKQTWWTPAAARGYGPSFFSV